MARSHKGARARSLKVNTASPRGRLAMANGGGQGKRLRVSGPRRRAAGPEADKGDSQAQDTNRPSAANLLVGVLDAVLPGDGIPDWMDKVLPGGKTGWQPWKRWFKGRGEPETQGGAVTPTPTPDAGGLVVTPDGPGAGPIQGGTTPIQGGTTPIQGGTTPIQGGTTPIQGGQTPGTQQGQTPGTQQGQAPGTQQGPAPAAEPEVVTPAPAPAQRCTVIDAQALIRSAPPDLSPNGMTFPLGAKLDISQAVNAGGIDYVYAKQVPAEGHQGPQLEGWTRASNLRNDLEVDPSLQPEAMIPLAGLSGLDRSMAVIYNERGQYIEDQASSHSIAEADVAGTLKVESGGKAFSPQGRAITRFENHIFWREWGRANPDVFNQHFQFDREGKAWEGHRWRRSPSDTWQGFHGSQASENEVLDFARTLADTQALRSASYGAGQVMGFNHGLLGYDSPQAMYEAFNGGVRAQLDGMMSYFENTSALAALRRGDYVAFAAAYNGTGQAEAYGALIRDAATAFRRVRPLAGDG